jgi:uptake hydrogenase large subunit
VARLVLGPFNRVEGDLEVQLEVADGQVIEARVNAPLFRGFEGMLVGRDPMDALTIAPRICGVCSVSQSVAAAKALADAAGLVPPANGLRATNLMLACENLADHLTHFYVFFMPDFTREDYGARRWFREARRRFAAVGGGGTECGEHNRAALAARMRWLELMGTLAGKWPHTGAVLPGGTSRAIETAERVRLLPRLREMRAFLERTLYGGPLEEWIALDTPDALDRWCRRAPHSDVALFLEIAADTELHGLGRGPGRYLSFGAYTLPQGGHALPRGVWDAACDRCEPLDSNQISEDMRHAWLAEGAGGTPLHPAQGVTQPQPDKAGAYTWNKAPRLAGRVIETGAIARQLVEGHPLIRAAVASHGGTVYTRVLARLMELARLLPLMESWLMTLEHHAPFHESCPMPAEAQGAGLSEAARGALGHWVRIENGRIASYQIIAPTSWNFSPRDAAGVPGALEAALVGAPVDADERGRGRSVAVQHIVRSFDPCMVCTVH